MRFPLSIVVCLFLTAHAQAQDYPISVVGGEVTIEVEGNTEPYQSTTSPVGPLDGVFDIEQIDSLSLPGFARANATFIFVAGPFPDLHDGYGAMNLTLNAELFDTTFPNGERLFGTLSRASGYYDIELTEPAIVSFSDVLADQEPVDNITLGGREIEFYYPPRSLQYQYRDMLLAAGTHRLAFDTRGEATTGGAQLIFNPVPEPSAVALLAIAAAGLVIGTTAAEWK